ncbi:hypothetical protein [Mangrovibacterium sp.]|uniref:hypothetical protein n=1 Tax=Mangrovibacterium sp. TaxID=1961364 RepID=UPI003569FCFF
MKKSIVQDGDFVLEPDDLNNSMLFEIAWEVCNQVGGIYTVIQSKVPSTLKKWGDNYFVIGPYYANQVATIFEPEPDPDNGIGHALQEMRDNGFQVHYGKWLVAGRPKAILFDCCAIDHLLANYKYLIWEHHNITIPDGDDLANKAVAFGFQIYEFFRILVEQKYFNKNLVAHFHEWLAGVAVPELRKFNLPVKTIFTTHATMLGRYLAMNDSAFYDHLPNYDWQKEANHFNIRHIVDLERAAAHGAHVFSTVSDITGVECEYLLGRKPDLVLPNGLNVERFEVLHKFQITHQNNKEKINDFVMGHFFNNYSFDLDNTLYFFTSGRFEYYNKGYDITLEALARLNWKMKEQNIDKTVVFFIVTRNPYTSMNPAVLQSRAMLEEIQRNCDEVQKDVAKSFYEKMVGDHNGFELPDLNQLVDDYKLIRLRRNLKSWHTNNMPPVVTHNLVDEEKDPIMNFLKVSKLLNFKEDKVKIVYHPEFISPSNPLWRMEYYDFIRGCHLGVFPSYYEPWGYTPLECCVSGLPSVTSDLSGFGAYIQKLPELQEKAGVNVITRKNRSMYDSAEDLANYMLSFTKIEKRERILRRNHIVESSYMFDWHELGRHYDEAYKRALVAE